MLRTFPLFCCLFLFACSAPQVPGPVQSGIDCPRQWNNEQGCYRLRHAGKVSFPGHELGLEGFTALDLARKQAVVVAWGVLGVKLFELTVHQDGVDVGYIQPGLAKIPNLAGKIRRCVWRSLVNPGPVDKACVLDKDGPWALQASGEDGVSYAYDQHGRLRVKRGPCSTDQWELHYRDYARHQGLAFPKRIDYQEGHFRVRLRLKGVHPCPAR